MSFKATPNQVVTMIAQTLISHNKTLILTTYTVVK